MPNLDPTIEGLKERAWQEVAAINQALLEGRIDEDGWHEAMASLIKPADLAAENPYAQAGYGGDAATWEASRGFIAEAIHRNGTFLDVGCAKGRSEQKRRRLKSTVRRPAPTCPGPAKLSPTRASAKNTALLTQSPTVPRCRSAPDCAPGLHRDTVPRCRSAPDCAAGLRRDPWHRSARTVGGPHLHLR